MPRQTILSLRVTATIETREDDTEFVFKKEVSKDIKFSQVDELVIHSLLEEALPEI